MNRINLQPLGDRIMIEPDVAIKQTTSGIIIPDQIIEKSQFGTVVACGPGRPEQPTITKVGDKVLYGKSSGTEVTYGDKTYLVMRESDIYAIL